MRLSRPPRFLLVLFALFLLGGQQAVLAHMVGHLAGTGTAAVDEVRASQGDDEHGAALTLSDVCTTCAALGGHAAPPPTSPHVAPVEAARGILPALLVAAAAASPPCRYAARAPPATL